MTSGSAYMADDEFTALIVDLHDEALDELESFYAEEEQSVKEKRWAIRSEIRNRMEFAGAKEKYVRDRIWKLNQDYVWDKSQLTVLLERDEIPAQALEQAWTPGHLEQVWIEGDWDLRKVKPLGKFGSHIAQVIQSAVSLGPARLSINTVKAWKTDTQTKGNEE
tara:strand:+ start:387 stop:878 length:492 start_codon:yes stop_codon:yes gene_type:complete